MEKRLEAVLEGCEGTKDELIPILQRVQNEYGYLPQGIMLEIARFAGVPDSRVYAVASFYAQFRFTPIGRNKIMVCRGTACHIKGAPRILQEMERLLGVQEGETTPDLEYTLETVACIGACVLAPVVKTGAEVHRKVQPKAVSKILKGR